MNRYVTLLIVVGFSFLPGCGSTEVPIKISLDVSQGVNPLRQIDTQFQAGQSRGIFFVFDPLSCAPATINQIDATKPTVQFPTQGTNVAVGADPLSSSFNINTSKFLPRTYYRVTMVAFDNINTTPTHQGVGDCPMNISLGGDNLTTICFGVYDPANPTGPLCPDTKPFAQCNVSTDFCD